MNLKITTCCVSIALAVVACREVNEASTPPVATSTPPPEPQVEQLATPKPVVPEAIVDESTRSELALLFAEIASHKPSLIEKPLQEADETAASFSARLASWNSGGARLVQKWNRDWRSFSLTRDPDLTSITPETRTALTRFVRANREKFKLKFQCVIADVVPVGGYGGAEVFCATERPGEAAFTVFGYGMNSLKKGELVQFSNIDGGSPSRLNRALQSFWSSGGSAVAEVVAAR